MGRRVKLFEDGRMLRDAMRRTSITEGECTEQLRSKASQAGFDGIKAAYLEPSGEISFIK